MKKFTGIMVVVMALALTVGTAWAWNAAEHVSIAPNGKGDVLSYPVYAAEEGWSTKLTIINTSDATSVVAKVVVRSACYSLELLDFFIYLSPTDVWTGTLSLGPNGPRVYSEDDSCLGGTRETANGDFASASFPMDLTLADTCDMEIFGHVNVFEAWHCDTLAPAVIDKECIRANYEGTTIPSDCATCIDATEFNETRNVLAGHYEVAYPLFYWHAAERAVAFKDYNITTDLTIGDETYFGIDARNAICEVEAALSKDNIAMPYYSQNSDLATLHAMTFPTKYAVVDSDCDILNVRSPFFIENSSSSGTANPWDICYGRMCFDLEENTPGSSHYFSPVPEEEKECLPCELNFIDAAQFAYEEGWANYGFAYTTTCDAEDSVTEVEYTGAPVIPTVLYWGLEGEFSIFYPAWCNGDVTVGEVPAPDYHYENAP